MIAFALKVALQPEKINLPTELLYRILAGSKTTIR